MERGLVASTCRNADKLRFLQTVGTSYPIVNSSMQPILSNVLSLCDELCCLHLLATSASNTNHCLISEYNFSDGIVDKGGCEGLGQVIYIGFDDYLG